MVSNEDITISIAEMARIIANNVKNINIVRGDQKNYK